MSGPERVPYVPAYVVEACAGDAVTVIRLGGTVAASRRLALRWLRERARRLADVLDPDPYTEWIPPLALRPVTHTDRDAPAELRAWADNDKAHAEVLRRLADGLPYRFTAYDDACWYRLLVRPVTAPRTVTVPLVGQIGRTGRTCRTGGAVRNSARSRSGRPRPGRLRSA
ncbi:hypothetical protein [Streptomyces sp. DT171]|uniref:hypothetical protein n=1 Tax=Streptomyces sp. DT171 TaxID=3416524 RepID=UPI003CE9ECB1